MAGSKPQFRHLSRDSAHRQALLRNLVTSLFKHESIQTTWHKAKEAQRLAEKLITMGKKNTEATKNRAKTILYTPEEIMPKLFGPIAERYAERSSGFTRVLRIEPIKPNQAPSAILELVDGPKDMRFAMTARTIARQRNTTIGPGFWGKGEGKGMQTLNEMTKRNILKVTQFRKNGVEELEQMVQRMQELGFDKERNPLENRLDGKLEVEEGDRSIERKVDTKL